MVYPYLGTTYEQIIMFGDMSDCGGNSNETCEERILSMKMEKQIFDAYNKAKVDYHEKRNHNDNDETSDTKRRLLAKIDQ